MELIHAAALSTAGWSRVLRSLASLTGCVAGGLTLERPATRQGTPLTYFGFDPDHVARTFDRYLPLNPLFDIERRMQTGFVVANADVVAPDVFRRSEFFNGWARPQGLCSPITVVIHRTPDAYVPLTLVRPDGAGEATARGRAILSRLAPHLAHAMDVTVRLRAAGDGGDACAMLEALPCGAALLDRDGRIVFANGAIRRLLDGAGKGPLACVAGRLAARDPASDGGLQAAVSAALGRGARPRAGHVVLPAPAGGEPLTARLVPVPASEDVWSALGGDVAARARCLVLLSVPDVARLARAYGLTPAEARVAARVATGRGLAAAARELGIARSTAQSHLDKIFQKTGTSRQAELVGLVRPGLPS